MSRRICKTKQTKGLICSSISFDGFSVIDPFPERIGLPGGSLMFLCSLGSA